MLPWIFAVKLGHIIHQEKFPNYLLAHVRRAHRYDFADKYARMTAFNSSSSFFS